LVVGCASLVMLRLMRHVPSTLAPPLVPTRWMISPFFCFLMHLLLSLLSLLLDLILMHPLCSRCHPL
jgi:hypothetical protein